MATVQTAIDMVKWQVDMQTGNRLVSADLIPFINLAYKDAWETIVGAYEDHFVKKAASDYTVAGGSGANTIDISALTDFLRIRALRRQVGTKWSDPLPTWQMAEWGYPDELSYRLIASTIELQPETTCAGTYRLHYVYLPTDLTATSDTLQDINGKVLAYIVDTIGIRVKHREEEEAAGLIKLRAELVERMAGTFSHRQGRPKKIADVRAGRRFRFMTRSGYHLP